MFIAAERNRMAPVEAQQALADDPAYASPFVDMPI